MQPILSVIGYNGTYISKKFEINSLPIKETPNQCINFIVFKYFYKQCPHYFNEVSVKTRKPGLSLRNSYHKPKQPFRKTSIGQSALSFIGPAL